MNDRHRSLLFAIYIRMNPNLNEAKARNVLKYHIRATDWSSDLPKTSVILIYFLNFILNI